MADTSVAITAGSGTNIDMRSESTNGDLRQVVVLGDPSANAGVAAVGNSRAGASDYGIVVRPLMPTNGSQDMPTMDAAGRAGFQKITDGTNTVTISSQGAAQVAGDTASAASDAGNPVKIGGKASSSLPTAVTDGQRVNGYFDLVGQQHTIAGGYSTVVTATLTRPSDTTAYAAGDQVADSTSSPTIITLSNCARANGGTGLITGCVLIDSVAASTKPVLELWVLDTTATPNNDNAAFAPSDGVANTVIGVIPLSSSFVGDSASTGNIVFDSGPLNIPFVCGASSTSLFGMLVVRNAYTPASAEVFKIRLRILQD